MGKLGTLNGARDEEEYDMAPADHLPLPDYDQLSLGDLRHRIRALSEDQLRLLIDHETDTASGCRCSRSSAYGWPSSRTARNHLVATQRGRRKSLALKATLASSSPRPPNLTLRFGTESPGKHRPADGLKGDPAAMAICAIRTNDYDKASAPINTNRLGD
jgi:hypothetical protein